MIQTLTAEDKRDGWRHKHSTDYRVLYMDEYGDIYDPDEYESVRDARAAFWTACEALLAGNIEWKGIALENRPALGIHDSVVCRVSDAEFAEQMMQRRYHKIVGFWPVVGRVY